MSEQPEIKSAYRTRANDQVFCYGPEGEHLPRFDGKFSLVRDRVLAALVPGPEFFISHMGDGHFTPVTKQQWLEYDPEG